MSMQLNDTRSPQWLVHTAQLAPANGWGIDGHLLSFARQMLETAELPFYPGEPHLMYRELKDLLSVLAAKGVDTTNLRQELETLYQQKDKAEQVEWVVQLQKILNQFPFAYNTTVEVDGELGPQTAGAYLRVAEAYCLQNRQPDASVLPLLETIASRLVRMECNNEVLKKAAGNNPYSILENNANALLFEETEPSGAWLLAADTKMPLVRFPKLLVSSHSVFADFTRWLMLLQLKGEGKHNQYCDLFIQHKTSDWQAVVRRPKRTASSSILKPDVQIPFEQAGQVVLPVKYIARTDFSIEVVTVYFTKGLLYLIDTNLRWNKSEAGYEAVLDGREFFENGAANASGANIDLLTKADFIKLFLLRKRREKYVAGNSDQWRYFELITTQNKDLLATVIIGLDIKSKAAPKLPFKEQVQQLYAKTPVLVRDDLQKGRWGGSSTRDGLGLTATVTRNLIPWSYTVKLRVQSTDPQRPLKGQVAFFLHDTFIREIRYTRAKDGVAEVEAGFCYEAFTVGAYTEKGVMLELDLNEQKGFPKGFYWQDQDGGRGVAKDFQAKAKAFAKALPVRVKNDPQKGRWGGLARQNGKILSAEISGSIVPGYCTVALTVRSDNRRPLEGAVAFFLHHSFLRPTRFARAHNGEATIRFSATEAFTVGVYTEDGTLLELDLNEVPGGPEGFYYPSRGAGSA